MSRLRSTNELPTYFVPKSVYDAAMDDLQQKDESINKTPTRITSHCHQKRYRYFNTQESALCHPNILEAARQAFEDRNFRVLYEIIYKGLEIRDFYFSAQLFEVSLLDLFVCVLNPYWILLIPSFNTSFQFFQYLYAAIEIDPKIKNRHEMLVNAVKGFKALNNDEEAEEFIKRAHSLIKIKKETDDTSESSDDEYKEANIKREDAIEIKQELDSD